MNVSVMTRYTEVFKGNLINSGHPNSPPYLLYLRIGQSKYLRINGSGPLNGGKATSTGIAVGHAADYQAR